RSLGDNRRSGASAVARGTAEGVTIVSHCDARELSRRTLAFCRNVSRLCRSRRASVPPARVVESAATLPYSRQSSRLARRMNLCGKPALITVARADGIHRLNRQGRRKKLIFAAPGNCAVWTTLDHNDRNELC